MGNEIGNVAGHVVQMVSPNEKPLKRSTSSKRLKLMECNFMEEGLCRSKFAVNVLPEMSRQLLVALEGDAKERMKNRSLKGRRNLTS